ncbi:MAG: hemolysin family protein [Pseudomonadota bacterium]|uniref:hemolysin family protein n=1 Tax=Thermithiobacillus tepidarius TaxID=929 RepID=UPI00040E90B0|nr:hemolysin family protein [Thermithiobacillus tepidarius]
MNDLLLVFLAFALVLLNGFFVAAEFAMVKMRATRVQTMAREHGLRGRILAQVHAHLDAYLSACQLGITLASLGLGWIGEPAFARLLEGPLLTLGVESPAVVHGISFAFAFFLISYLHIVLGELAPKSMAIRQPEPVSLWTAVPLYSFYWLMYPAIWLLNQSANFILRTLGQEMAHEEERPHSPEELKMIVMSSHAQGELIGEAGEILARTLDFSDLTAGELMRPAADMVCLFVDKPAADNIATMDRYRYTRYPVCEEDRSNVIGIVHVKDLFAAQRRGDSLSDLGVFMRPIAVVPRDLPAFDLFRRFREGESHFAVVTDDLGTVTGFITMEHILEALVGQIQDEFQRQKSGWQRLPDGSFLGAASLPIYTLERELDIEIPAEEVDTMGGLVMWRLERLPQPGERVAFDDFDVLVREMQGPRILRVQIYPKRQREEESI